MEYILKKFKSRNDWLKNRGLGGSSASAILNKNPYLSANELYDSFVFGAKHTQIENEAIVRGNLLEPHIRKEFETLNQEFKVIAPPKNNRCFVKKSDKRLTASLDGLLIHKETGEKGFLEIKTREVRRKDEVETWKNEKIPDNYFIQILHYFLITGFSYCCLASHLIRRNYANDRIEEVSVIYQWFYRKDYEEEIAYLYKKELEFLDNTANRQRPRAIISILKKKG